MYLGFKFWFSYWILNSIRTAVSILLRTFGSDFRTQNFFSALLVGILTHKVIILTNFLKLMARQTSLTLIVSSLTFQIPPFVLRINGLN